MSDALGQFIGDVRDIFVAAERDKATARDPHAAPKPPVQKPQRLGWRVKNLEIIFDYPLMEGVYDKEWKESMIVRVYNLFGRTTEGVKLLNALANFPIHPQLPAIKRINVGFQENMLPSDDPAADTDGMFGPQHPAAQYDLWVKFKKGAVSGPGRWPNTTKSCNIVFTHKRDDSHMAVTLFHELLHIWFVNAYWLYFLQKGNTGHGKVEDCEYDQVQTATGTRRPFLDWLVVFYAEIDKIERGG